MNSSEDSSVRCSRRCGSYRIQDRRGFRLLRKRQIVVKFAHVVAAKGSPKGETATALSARVNDEMNGKLCMEVYPNSQLYDDDKEIGRASCRERVCQYV